jgi:hypothetical protein
MRRGVRGRDEEGSERVCSGRAVRGGAVVVQCEGVMRRGVRGCAVVVQWFRVLTDLLVQREVPSFLQRVHGSVGLEHL